MSLEVEKDAGWLVKISAEAWEINLRAQANDLRSLRTIRGAAWDARGSLQVGRVAGATAFWSCDGNVATILVGHDDETWDVAITVPVAVVDEIVRQAGSAARS